MDTLPNEIFVIATNRRDGALPDPVKILNREIYHDERTASHNLVAMKEDYGDSIGLYRGEIALVARLDADVTEVEDRRSSIKDLSEEQLFDLLQYMYRSGRADGVSGADLNDASVYNQVREDAAEFIVERLDTGSRYGR